MKKFNSYFILRVLCILLNLFLVSEAYQYAFTSDGWRSSPGKSIEKFFDFSTLTVAQVDDHIVDVSGYVTCKVDFPNHLQAFDFTTKTLKNGIWSDSPIAHHSNDYCKSLQDSSKMWYNFSKNLVNCPPKKGEKWIVDDHRVNLIMDLPLAMEQAEVIFSVTYLPPFIHPELDYDFKMFIDAIVL